MRTLSQRELRLAMLTGLVVVAGLTWTVVRGQLTELREARQREESAQLEQLRQQGMMRKRPDLIRQLQIVRGQLPRHPEGRDLKPEFARQVQALAGQAGLQLTGLTPEPEEALTDLGLHRSAVQGSWSGPPEAIIGFLVELQQLGPVADVQELRIRNRSGNRPELTGTFTLEFVYARIPESEWEAEVDTPPQSPNDGAPE